MRKELGVLYWYAKASDRSPGLGLATLHRLARAYGRFPTALLFRIQPRESCLYIRPRQPPLAVYRSCAQAAEHTRIIRLHSLIRPMLRSPMGLHLHNGCIDFGHNKTARDT